jgi:3-mercaptopyruvate sulfurtransferase SseA
MANPERLVTISKKHSNKSCIASIIGYQLLTRLGYKNVRRYAGGIEEWQEAGYPIDGSFVS